MTSQDRIEAKDLRIGNIIRRKSTGETFEIDGGHISCIESENHYPQFEGSFEAIPLDEEWLIKLGFISIGELHPTFKINQYIIENGIIQEDIYSLRQIINKEESLCICNSRLKYVHQLQNLYYSLTGTELQIKR